MTAAETETTHRTADLRRKFDMPTIAPKPLPRCSYPSTTDPEARAAYAAGLRHLADVIESDPDCPYPTGPMALFVSDSGNQAQTAARLRRALGGGKWVKNEYSTNLYLSGMCAGVPVDLWLDRDAVCERVVVGTDEVTETVPVGEDIRPVETVTREVERIEWICSPLLADEAPAEVSA